MSPQSKQTDEEHYKTLLRDIELAEKEPMGKGDNIELTEEDEEILSQIYGKVEKGVDKSDKI